jgi:hypothetical protein
MVHDPAVDLHRIHAAHVRAAKRRRDAKAAIGGSRRAATGQKLREADEPAVEHRQLRQLLLTDHRRQVGLARLDLDGRASHHLNALFNRAERQRHLQVGDLPYRQHDLLGVGAEAGQARYDGIGARLQSRRPKPALLIGDDDTFDSRGVVGDGHGHAGQRTGRRVHDGTAEFGRLCPSRVRQHQNRYQQHGHRGPASPR